MKYIFVTGGNISALGKGIAAASVGTLLKARGWNVAAVKVDPYLNVDAGTMSPYQHGEVFVTKDGAETDLDLGHYERFLDTDLFQVNNVTAGRVYRNVLDKERKGEYLGATVQVVPHVINEIKSLIKTAGEGKEILLVELGGTVGDIESAAFVESIRQFRKDVGQENVCYIHLTLLPYIPSAGEVKTKLTQHSVRELRGLGIQPDIIIARTTQPIDQSVRDKIALFCDISTDAVIQGLDTNCIYRIPLKMESEGLARQVEAALGLEPRKPSLGDWTDFVESVVSSPKKIEVAIVGKYITLEDSYKSVTEALIHAGAASQRQVTIRWVHASDVKSEEDADRLLSGVHGVVVPGGFDNRGLEGKIAAAKWCRETDTPYLGLCLGLQVMVIEFARNVAGLAGANTTEAEPDTPYPVIALLEEQERIRYKGGTMRLGDYPCHLKEGTLAHRLYGKSEIAERHRHRYEVNNAWREILEEEGILWSGCSPDGFLVEVAELPHHPFFIASQFHPEFTSRPLAPNPLFGGFLRAAVSLAQQRITLAKK
ncbi:CTP synthase [bacterium]|nr:CTP synthase [bacterium]